MKKCLIIFLLSFIFFSKISSVSAFAQSDYVLPYPSSMPGSFMYKIRLISEKVMEYWYFGNFSKFTYNLKQSDKYLVEAKTLFEYRQYLLGIGSLEKSDKYFLATFKYLKSAKAENKDISEKYSLLKNAAKKHTEVLTRMKNIVPSKFLWQPEKLSSTKLNLQSNIDSSVKIRAMKL